MYVWIKEDDRQGVGRPFNFVFGTAYPTLPALGDTIAPRHFLIYHRVSPVDNAQFLHTISKFDIRNFFLSSDFDEPFKLDRLLSLYLIGGQLSNNHQLSIFIFLKIPFPRWKRNIANEDDYPCNNIVQRISSLRNPKVGDYKDKISLIFFLYDRISS